MSRLPSNVPVARRNDYSVRLWDVARGTQLHRFDRPQPDKVVFHPNGRLLVYWSQYRLSGQDPLTGQSHPTIPDNDVSAFAFSPDGHWIATAHAYGVIRVCEPVTGGDVLRFDATPPSVGQLAWTADGRRLFSGNADQTVLVWDASPPGWSAGQRSGAAALETCLGDLKSPDAGRAYRALWTLAAEADAAVELLERQLQPDAGERAAQLGRLIANLDHESFRRREAASQALAQLGASAEPALAAVLAGNPSIELRARALPLLERALAAEKAPTAEELFMGRALVILERIDSARSRRLLERLSTGAPYARQTVAARLALDRLERRRATGPTAP